MLYIAINIFVYVLYAQTNIKQLFVLAARKHAMQHEKEPHDRKMDYEKEVHEKRMATITLEEEYLKLKIAEF